MRACVRACVCVCHPITGRTSCLVESRSACGANAQAAHLNDSEDLTLFPTRARPRAGQTAGGNVHSLGTRTARLGQLRPGLWRHRGRALEQPRPGEVGGLAPAEQTHKEARSAALGARQCPSEGQVFGRLLRVALFDMSAMLRSVSLPAECVSGRAGGIEGNQVQITIPNRPAQATSCCTQQRCMCQQQCLTSLLCFVSNTWSQCVKYGGAEQVITAFRTESSVQERTMTGRA